MKRLYLLVEGQTEQAFCSIVLKDHLARFGVQLLRPILAGAFRRSSGKVAAGGLGSHYARTQKKLVNLLRQESDQNVRFSTMFDLYGLPTDFPGFQKAKAISDPLARAIAIEAALKIDLVDRRFVPYLSVHEFEALILADPAALNADFPGCEKRVSALTAACGKYQTPEHINDRPTSHPKALITHPDHLPDFEGVLNGPGTAARIGLARLREKCLHFGDWLTCLEQLDSEA